MRIAVLVNGVYPNILPRHLLMECHDRRQATFAGCDLYYQMWDTKENRHIIKKSGFPLSDNIVWTVQPNILYKPYDLAIADDTLPENFKKKYLSQVNDKSSSMLEYHKQTYDNRTAQHLGFQNLWQYLTEDYDYYFRTRWDTWFSKKFDLKKALDLVDQGVVGYGVNLEGDSMYNGQVGIWRNRYDRTRRMREITRDFIESGDHTIIKEEREGQRYNNFLSDFCIGFKQGDYMGNAHNLSDEKKLYPAEWGWHQLMTGKRKHINVNGLAAIMRIVDPSLHTFQNIVKQ
jgi:hypothetical protein|tara:strand:- start:2864 stop:3727 length:864 start_codon:yes stop_codon:yes gene_type:complete